MAEHLLTLDQDEDGWDTAECSCGWRLMAGVPGADIAAEFWHDHVTAAALTRLDAVVDFTEED